MKRFTVVEFVVILATLMSLSGCSGSGTDEGNTISSPPSEVARRLNDTGITTGGITGMSSNGALIISSCPDPEFPGQDGDYGRDVKFNDSNDGDSGFSFTKIDLDGNPLPATAPKWACIKDNVTGLLWEVKTTDGGFRDKVNTYSWYNSSQSGIAVGTRNGGECSGANECDTSSYVTAVNSTKLCGSDTWRLPNVNELLSIAHYWKNPGLPVDNRYFPETAQQVWSATPHPFSQTTAWSVWFKWGSWASPTEKNAKVPILLVSGKSMANPGDTDRFQDNQNGTISDNDTGLMWMKCVAGSTWNGSACVDSYLVGTGCGGDGWKGVLNHAKCLNERGGFAGYQDWRLPNIKELASVVQWESDEHFSQMMFPNLPLYAPIFSSSPYAFAINKIWGIQQSNAEISAIDRGSWGAALLVRDQ